MHTTTTAHASMEGNSCSAVGAVVDAGGLLSAAFTCLVCIGDPFVQAFDIVTASELYRNPEIRRARERKER